MTDFELFLLIIVFILFIVQIVLGWFLFRFYRLLETGRRYPGTISVPGIPDGGAGTSEPGPGLVQEAGPRPAGSRLPHDTDIHAGSTGIHESLLRVCEKYGFFSITLATKDGLSIASSLESPEEDAARFSDQYNRGIAPDDENIRLLGLECHGESVIGIIRGNGPLPDTWLIPLEKDLRAVMAQWL
ncbi:MAG: hypothetical protein APR53_00600 [Methanoculleus sp. SDB]|nr:MAG: hypothetical protein APR53_00600 [Methanoculleus sp. SDB]